MEEKQKTAGRAAGDTEIAGRMVLARKKIGLTQKQAAERIGIHQTNLSAMESAKTKLSIDVLLKACKLYQVSSDWLLFNKQTATDDYLEQLGTMALPYAELVYNLAQLEDFNKVREINHYICGLLENQWEEDSEDEDEE